MMLKRPRFRPAQSIVEFVLVLGLFIALVFGAIAAIQIAMTNFTVAQAARAAANQAALIGGADGSTGALPVRIADATGTVATTARQILDSGMTTRGHGTNATISVACATKPCQRYAPIVVSISYPDRVWVPIGSFNTFTAVSSATRTSEQDRQTTSGRCGLPGAPPCR